MEEDILLITKIKANDHTAFDDLFRKYYKYLVVTAYQYLKDDHQAKDMVQEIFCDIWQRRHQLDISNPKAFLRRAVINKCLAGIRKNSRVSYNEDTLELNTSSAPYVDQSVSYKEVNQLIEQVLEALPSRCKEVFKLSRYEQLSHKEIAQRLDISTKTIENQMTKALKTLRTELKKHGILGLIAITFLLL